MSDPLALPGEADLPKVPTSTAGWLLLLWGRLEQTVKDECGGIRAELAQKADKADLDRFEGRLSNVQIDVEQLKEDRKARKAVHHAIGGAWKIAGAALGGAASVAVVVGVLHSVH